MEILRRFAVAWRFLTVFPFPFLEPGEGEGKALAASVPYFPLVGLGLGIIAWAVAAILYAHLPPLVAAVAMVAVLAAFSGGLHLDGLADCGDGLLFCHDREKSLAVMKDSRIGAFGALAVVFVLLLKVACLASVPAAVVPAVLFAAPLLGRTAIMVAMVKLPYVRAEGLGKLFDPGRKTLSLFAALAWSIAVCWAVFGVAAMIAALVWWLLFNLLWLWFLRRRLGGATGDAYGASCEFGELSVMLAIAAMSGGASF